MQAGGAHVGAAAGSAAPSSGNELRPDPALWRYYLLGALLSSFCILPLTALILVPLWFKYRTLRYRIDDEGLWMTVGMFFRKEVNVAYRRIQDIHLSRNLFQRYFGIATVSIQTASGSATPEMEIEGVRDAEALRDMLYLRSRGARGDGAASVPELPVALPRIGTAAGDGATAVAPAAASSGPSRDEALALLREIAASARALREAAERRGAHPGAGGGS